jgi:type IV secretory pathway VirB10-like protein
VRKGQERLFVMWNEVTDPNGVRVVLDSIGSDPLGTSGMGGTVDMHFVQIFGVSAKTRLSLRTRSSRRMWQPTRLLETYLRR